LSFHLKLDENMNLKQSHKIVDKIEKEIRKKLHVEPTIHVDPLKNN
jgi:divalent metal cation (Fe/Co/Zn/Cd) transporter